MKKIVFMLIAVLMAYTAVAEQKKSCAVLNFVTTDGVDSGQAGMVANRYAVLLKRYGLYQKIIPRYSVNDTLIRADFRHGSVSTLASAVNAGKLLNADFVIYGQIGQKQDEAYLATYLVDVKSGKQHASSISRSRESIAVFLKTAAAVNIKGLFDIPNNQESGGKSQESSLSATPNQGRSAVKELGPALAPIVEPEPMLTPIPIPIPEQEEQETGDRRQKTEVARQESQPESSDALAMEDKTEDKPEPILYIEPMGPAPILELPKPPTIIEKPESPSTKATEDKPVPIVEPESSVASRESETAEGNAMEERPKPESEPKPGPKPGPEPAVEPEEQESGDMDQEAGDEELNTVEKAKEDEAVSLEEISVKDSEIEQLTLPESDTDPEITPLHKWPWLNRVAVGTRFTHFALMNGSGDFLGSIDTLDTEQDYLPYKWFVEYMFNHRYGIELTWDKIKASTITSSDGHNDGDIVLSGPIITGFARGNFDVKAGKINKVHPYGGFGVAFMMADFEHEGWWHHGFGATEWQDAEAAYNNWVNSGSEEWPNNGYQRTMTLDDTIGFVLTGGCSLEFNSNWSLDLYLRYMKVSVDDTYTLSNYGSTFRTTSYTFDMDNVVYGLGVKYDF